VCLRVTGLLKPLARAQSFLKNILDVADNLERAYGAVPADALSEEEGKVRVAGWEWR
jgi:molecular chaperone GrpE (heat shock protein)